MAEYLNPQGTRYPWMSTFVKFERALANRETAREESSAIWNTVAFYNFLTEAVDGPRQAGTQILCQQSEAAFFDVLEELSPDFIVVWGWEQLWEELPKTRWSKGKDISIERWTVETGSYSLATGKKTVAFPIYHPSSGFSWHFWHRVIRKVIEESGSV